MGSPYLKIPVVYLIQRMWKARSHPASLYRRQQLAVI